MRGHGTCWCTSLFSNFSAPSGAASAFLLTSHTTQTPGGKLLLSLPPPILRTRSARTHRQSTALCPSPHLARTHDSDAREAAPQPPTADPPHSLCQNAPTKHCTQRQLSALHTAHHAPPGTALATHLCPSPHLARTHDSDAREAAPQPGRPCTCPSFSGHLTCCKDPPCLPACAASS